LEISIFLFGLFLSLLEIKLLSIFLLETGVVGSFFDRSSSGIEIF